MREYNKHMYCSRCKKRGTEGFVKYARRKLLDGTYKQYHLCNTCNTTRLNKYYTTPSGKKAVRKSVANYAKRNPDRHKSWQLASEAQKKGLLIKRGCEVCGDTKVHRHHPDPNEPLNVVYLCPLHHKREHLNSKEKAWQE